MALEGRVVDRSSVGVEKTSARLVESQLAGQRSRLIMQLTTGKFSRPVGWRIPTDIAWSALDSELGRGRRCARLILFLSDSDIGSQSLKLIG